MTSVWSHIDLTMQMILHLFCLYVPHQSLTHEKKGKAKIGPRKNLCLRLGDGRKRILLARTIDAHLVSVVVSVDHSLGFVSVRGAAENESHATRINTGDFRCAAFWCMVVRNGLKGLRVSCSAN